MASRNTLGEALSERARLQRRVGELRARIAANVTVQEDGEVAEDPTVLLEELEGVHRILHTLIARINLTNARTEVEGFKTLTEALAHRDYLAGLVKTYESAADATQTDALRYMRSELKLERRVNVPHLRRKADQTAAELCSLDNDIQAVNWTTELT